MFSFFLYIKKKHNDVELLDLFENCDVSKLDINRIYRYLDKYIKEDAVNSDDEYSVASDIELGGIIDNY